MGHQCVVTELENTVTVLSRYFSPGETFMAIDNNEIAVYPFQRFPIFVSHGASATLPSLPRSHALSTALKHTTHSYAKKICVQQLVELQAAVLPQKTALIIDGAQMSYGELNRRANQVAQHLQRLGVRPDVPVGICMECLPALIVAQLGILKAGGAYVVLDPADAPEQLAAILAESNLPVLLTQENLLASLPAHASLVVCLDADRTLFETYDTENPLPATSLENLAYILSSSISPMQPEEGVVTHMGLLNLVNWHHRTFAVSADACVTYVSSSTCAVAGWEIWPYLAIGSTLCLPENAWQMTPLLLQNWLLANEITHAFLPPSLAGCLLTLAWPARSSLRYLFTCADGLPLPSAVLPFALVTL
jgi:non-ribosomal peptide synthetase component F